MSNPNYEAGVRWERDCKKHYEKLGYIVIRASGSHGKWDLVCVKPGSNVVLVQCKVVATKTQAAALIKKYKANPPTIPSECYVQYLDVKIKHGGVLSDFI